MQDDLLYGVFTYQQIEFFLLFVIAGTLLDIRRLLKK
jgi:hypothetical protein